MRLMMMMMMMWCLMYLFLLKELMVLFVFPLIKRKVRPWESESIFLYIFSFFFFFFAWIFFALHCISFPSFNHMVSSCSRHVCTSIFRIAHCATTREDKIVLLSMWFGFELDWIGLDWMNGSCGKDLLVYDVNEWGRRKKKKDCLL